ncbi:MAG: PAS domain S-box protein [Candidatus Hydrogenedentes bacterium]|nr:PAS domain S-box protein [Candidatus Hydrogenedentota bacterium]
MTEGMAILDADDHVQYANHRLCDLMGVRLEDVLGLDAKRFLLPDQLPVYLTQKRLRRRGDKSRYEIKARTPAGQVLHLQVSPSPLFDRDGNFLGSFGVYLDLTEQKRAQQALATSEERFRLLLENSRDVVYRFNLREDCYDFVSPSIKGLLGYSQAEFAAFTIADQRALLHPDDDVTFMEYAAQLRKCAREGCAAGLGEYRMRNKAGQMRWLSDSAALLLDESGEPLARIGAARDITDHKMAERTLLAASRMEATTTLAGGIAHDFNNLMAAVLANAELLEMKLGGDAEARQMLRVIEKSAEQAGDLASQMLAYARGGKYQLSVIELNQVIEEVLALESHSFNPKIEIERRLSCDLWPVYADASQMSQVAMNLTINAAEAMPEGGRLGIITRNCLVDEDFAQLHAGLKPGRYVYLAVEDTGQGMTRQVMARVFEPFFSTKFQGRGLGLAAVYGIVKNHGGHISAYSEPGRGSIFKIYLPASEMQLESAPARVEHLPTGSETVLVVDDDEAILDATQQMLGKLGYQVLLARNGREALRMLARHGNEVKVVLLDLAMPVLGGAEAQAVMARRTPDLPVIICSGYELDPSAQDILNRGARAFLQKPFRMQVLASEIRRVLDN